MNRRTLLLTIGLTLLGAAPLWAHPTVSAENLEQRISSARSSDDHEALADYYDSQAAENEKLAVYHAGMTNVFTKGGHPYNCRELIKQYRSAAETNKALAREHRQMAKQASQQSGQQIR